MAHALHMRDVEMRIDQQELDRIIDYITAIVGLRPTPVPFWYLEHFKNTASTDYYKKLDILMFGDNVSPDAPMSIDAYHKWCCTARHTVSVLKLTHDGKVSEERVEPDVDGSFDFHGTIGRPYTLQGPAHRPLCTVSTRKSKLPKDRELKVYSWPREYRELDLLGEGITFTVNTLASSLVKEPIYGDALVVQESKETAFQERVRVIDFTKSLYEEMFTVKRKAKVAEVKALTATEYKEARQEMQSSLHSFEAEISSSSERPQDLARGAAMPPPSGKELKEVALILGNVPPKKRKRLRERLEGAMPEAAVVA